MKTEKNTPLRVVFSLDTEEEGLFPDITPAMTAESGT